MIEVHARRAVFPALDRPERYLDGAGGTQVPRPVIDAMSDALARSMSNTGWSYPASHRSESTVRAAREAVGDLLDAPADGVVFGPSMTALTFRLAGALADTWRAGDEIVVSELDHDANIRPWVLAAQTAGVTVRWARVDPDTCTLPVDQFDELVTPRTRLVAVTAASNVVGTRPDVRGVVERAHAVGALVYLDAVHAAPHVPISARELGADFVACSAYKFFGPHVGCVASTAETLDLIRPAKLAPSPETVPERFELGTLPFEQLAGTAAAVDYIASLAPTADGSRSARLRDALLGVESYGQSLFPTLLTGLQQLDGVQTYCGAGDRCPTVSFRVDGLDSRAVATELAAAGYAVPSGQFYAPVLMRRLGVDPTGGVLRVGVTHYNTSREVDGFVHEVAGVVSRLRRRAPSAR